MTATPAPPARQRILSGVQPSGKLHLGNYFGAIRQHIALQDEGDCFYFIADYHSMTTVTDAPERRANTHDIALDYLAPGLDPATAPPFRPSDPSELPERTCSLTPATTLRL